MPTNFQVKFSPVRGELRWNFLGDNRNRELRERNHREREREREPRGK